MNSNITPELLIKYLDNELQVQERADVETQLAIDASAKDLLERLRLSRQAFKHYALKEQVAHILHTQIKKREIIEEKPAVKIHWLRKMMHVAALLLVLMLIAGLVHYSLLDGERLYRSRYATYTLSTSRDNTVVTELEKAYRANDMKRVIILYERSGTHSMQEHFMAGQAYLATDDAEKAVRAFEDHLAANATLTFKPYQEDGEYYLALAYLKAGNNDKAISLFDKIHREASHAYHNEVNGWFLLQLQWLHRKQSK